MPKLTRRYFAASLITGAGVFAAGSISIVPPARARAIVVGGGPSGATAAIALARGRPDVDVVLVERDPASFGARYPVSHASLPSMGRPTAGPDLAALQRAGVSIVLDEAVATDWDAARVSLFSGRSLAFDTVLMAPGIVALDEAIPGLDAVARHSWPAAWGSPREAARLRASLEPLPERGRVVLPLPAQPSHTEVALNRAVDLAGWLSQSRPRARLTVLDGGTTLASEWQRRAPQSIAHQVEWRSESDGGRVVAVDARRGLIETNHGTLTADAVNFVPVHGAGQIARNGGLVDSRGWCPCDNTGRSSIRPTAMILGDAAKHAKRSVVAAHASAMEVVSTIAKKA